MAGALRGTPGSACPQPEPNATELPSRAPDRPKLIELQATKPSPTPTRAKVDIATTPGCDLQATAPSPTPTCRARSCASAPSPAGARRRELLTSLGCRPHRASRPHPRQLRRRNRHTPHPAPLAHADACGGTPRRNAGLKTSRPRRQSAWKMPRKPSLGLPHQQQASNVQRALDATMKKPFAWVSHGALGTNLVRPGAPDCLPQG